VDQAEHSERLIDRLGISFQLGSDPDQKVVQTFGVQNPDTRELALHAVYILDQQARVIYRKVGSRRPVSAELIDAIDAWRGDYPRRDKKQGRPQRRVAYPSNNFQTLIEMAHADALPDTIAADELRELLSAKGSSDDMLIAFRRFVAANSGVPQDDLLVAAAWLARQRFIASDPVAVSTGKELRRRLRRVADLEAELEATTEAGQRDTTLHTLAAARGGLSKVRADVQRGAAQWRLAYAQGALRGYREVAFEAHAR